MKTLAPNEPLIIPVCEDASPLTRDNDIHAVCKCGHEMFPYTASLDPMTGADSMGDRFRTRIRIGLKCPLCHNSVIYRLGFANIDHLGLSTEFAKWYKTKPE